MGNSMRRPGRSKLSTVSGSRQGFADGHIEGALFNYPSSIGVCRDGSILIADMDNHRIRRIRLEADARGVSTIAGSKKGYQDGPVESAAFNCPRCATEAANGDIIVADTHNNRIRRITPAGVVSTIAGSEKGFADGDAKVAKFNYPTGVWECRNGDLIVADMHNHRIRRITPDGQVSTIAGSGRGLKDGMASEALFRYPRSAIECVNGDIIVADTDNHRIRQITPQGEVSTMAGTTFGFEDGDVDRAKFHSPFHAIEASNGDILVSDMDNHKIRRILPDGVVVTVAGSQRGFKDDHATKAMLKYPRGSWPLANGDLLVADTDNNRIRRVSPRTSSTSIQHRENDGYGSVKADDDLSAIGMEAGTPSGLGDFDADNQLFSCCSSEAEVMLGATFCPWYHFAEARQKTGQLSFMPAMFLFGLPWIIGLYVFIVLLGDPETVDELLLLGLRISSLVICTMSIFFFHAHLKKLYRMPKNLPRDCIESFFCPCCIIIQDVRHAQRYPRVHAEFEPVALK